jgi:hypothetical protein
MSPSLIGVPVLGCVDYRPQWFYPSPRGCREQAFSYFYDLFNAAYSPLAVLSTQENIPLAIETGSKFLWRGVRLNLGVGIGGIPVTLLVRFFDPFGNALSSDYVPVIQYVNPSGSAAGGLPVPIEPEIECPPGSGILVSFKNIDPNNTAQLPEITLYGLKRYEGAL